MKGTLISRNAYGLALTATVLVLFFSAYAAYSVTRFNVLSTRSVVKSNVVMKVIQHGVRSVCPRCGFKGVPTCPQCTVEMYWNGYKGTFLCPACGKGGFPRCRRCGDSMTWIEAR